MSVYRYRMGRILGPEFDQQCVGQCTPDFARVMVRQLNREHRDARGPLISPPPRKPTRKPEDTKDHTEWQNQAARLILKLFAEARLDNDSCVTIRAVKERIGGTLRQVTQLLERMRLNGLISYAWHGKLRIGWRLTERGFVYAEQLT